MSPEIIRGEVADRRSDIYPLGVILYEMLSGRPPFVADSAMTLIRFYPLAREIVADKKFSPTFDVGLNFFIPSEHPMWTISFYPWRAIHLPLLDPTNPVRKTPAVCFAISMLG